jgi:hypothetical protein
MERARILLRDRFRRAFEAFLDGVGRPTENRWSRCTILNVPPPQPAILAEPSQKDTNVPTTWFWSSNDQHGVSTAEIVRCGFPRFWVAHPLAVHDEPILVAAGRKCHACFPASSIPGQGSSVAVPVIKCPRNGHRTDVRHLKGELHGFPVRFFDGAWGGPCRRSCNLPSACVCLRMSCLHGIALFGYWL